MAQPWKRSESGIISCVLWKKQRTVNGRSVTVLTATVERRYRDKDGNWKSGDSFDRSDIPRVIYSLQRAYEVMVEEEHVQVELDEEMLQRSDERLPQA